MDSDQLLFDRLYNKALAEAGRKDPYSLPLKYHKKSQMKRARFVKMLPSVRRGDHMHIVDRKQAGRFFDPPHGGGFGRSETTPIDRPKTTGKKTRLDDLQDAAASAGFYVTTYSPGDGTTRYRFSKDKGSYFSVRGEHTALGLKEAWKYLQ